MSIAAMYFPNKTKRLKKTEHGDIVLVRCHPSVHKVPQSVNVFSENIPCSLLARYLYQIR